ncbi:ankyrin repeat domain-containing protein [Naegleria gruberi]|uniref:Ankyrin repeat domain-containing protein n=1 Tax=Naegleria gruberi TaxID=5762 RepID=D2V9G9_NAEGR|nr:ankyrin repeat domain-containing protein [Naegleria gruberi]EFC46590.1 ankyrin repeat domain-containing protein [Naegleria gruberi]|eukprot:XP_002679334.1 ankyrin repeat domain-containing protein [Naegleria gruberi strain NEG-M]
MFNQPMSSPPQHSPTNNNNVFNNNNNNGTVVPDGSVGGAAMTSNVALNPTTNLQVVNGSTSNNSLVTIPTNSSSSTTMNVNGGAANLSAFNIPNIPSSATASTLSNIPTTIGNNNNQVGDNISQFMLSTTKSVLSSMSSPTMSSNNQNAPLLPSPSSIQGLLHNSINSNINALNNNVSQTTLGGISQLLNPTTVNFNQQTSHQISIPSMNTANQNFTSQLNNNVGVVDQQSNQWMNFNQSSNNYQTQNPSSVLSMNQNPQLNVVNNANSGLVNNLLNNQQQTTNIELFNMLLASNGSNMNSSIDMNNNIYNNNSNVNTMFNNGLIPTNNINPMNNINISNNIPNSPPMNNSWKSMENPVLSPNSYNRQNQFTNQNFVNQQIPSMNISNNNMSKFNQPNNLNNQNMFGSYNMNNMNSMNNMSMNMNNSMNRGMGQQIQFQNVQFPPVNNNLREIVFEQSGYAKKRRDSSTPSASTTPSKKSNTSKKEKPTPQAKTPKTPKTAQTKTPQTKEKPIAKPSVPSSRIDILKPLPDRIIYYILHFLPSFPDYGSFCQVSKRFSEICQVAYLQLDTLYLKKVSGVSNAKGAINRFYSMREDYIEDVDVISVRRQLVSKENDPNKRKSKLDNLKVEKKDVTKLVLNQVNVDNFKKLFENSYLSESLKDFTLIGQRFNSNSLKQFFTSLPKEVESVTLIGCLFTIDLPFAYYASLRKDISPKMEILFSEIVVVGAASNDEKSRKNKKKKLEEENPNPFIPTWMTVQELKDSVTVDTLKKIQNLGLDLLTDSICDGISGACAACRYGDIDCVNYVLRLINAESISPSVNMIYQTLLFNRKNLLPIINKFVEIFPRNLLLSARFTTAQQKQSKSKPTTSEKLNYSFQSLLRVDQSPSELPTISKQSIEDRQLTPYLCACAFGSLEICTLISPEPVLQIDTDSNTGLHLACMNGNIQVAKYLIEKNHSLDAKNNKSQSILHSLMLCPPEKDSDDLTICLQMVLDRLAQRGNLTGILSARDLLGNTCLHYAVENRHSGGVKLLLDYYSKGDYVENYLKIANAKEMTPILLVFFNNAPRNDKTANILISLMNNNFENNFKELIIRKDEDGDVISSKTIFTEILESESSFSTSFLNQYLSVMPEKKDSILNYSPDSSSASLIYYCVSLPKDTTLLVKWLIANGANVQQLDSSGKTFLHVAIEKESIEDLDSVIDSLSLILSAEQLKQLIMTQDKEKKYTVLHQCAISDKYAKSCAKLISVGADPLALDAEKNTPLMVSISFANYDASQYLLTNESKNFVNGNNVSPIILLLRNSKDLKHFLNEKEINQADYNTSIEKLEELAMKMLESGVDIASDTILDYVDEDRPSALMLAIEGGLSMEIITKIVEHPDVFINHQTAKSLVTPLHVACEEGYSEVVTLLIQKGANILMPDNNKAIPIVYAIIHSNSEAIELILQHIDSSCKIRKEAPNAEKLLERAKFFIRDLPVECLESFMLQAVSENILVDLLNRILSLRMEQRNTSIEKDRDYKIFTDQGASVLMVASQEGKLEVFKSYLEYMSTFETFNGGEFSEISEILKLGDQSNDTLAHYACMAPDNNKSTAAVIKEKLAILEILLKYSASLDIQNDEGNTPLHIACREGFTPLAKFLLKQGCDKNVTNNDGNTPDTLADDGGHYDLLAACFDEEVPEKPAKTKTSNRNKRGTKRKSSSESDDEFVASDQDADSDEESDEDSEMSDDEAPTKTIPKRATKIKREM